MKLEIVTPVRRLLEGDADEVVIRGLEGEFGVLPSHKPFLAALGTGPMTYRQGGKTHAVLIDGGLCEVLEDRITVLAEYAQPQSEIDLNESRNMLADCENKLKALPAGDDQSTALTHDIERWQARISTAMIK